ncbi:MAG: DUF2339 domain-containing protein, partial [Bacteroidota bacterium]|nr:DUF2339 domain-containing protein [Bacteroidota bacterium]
MTNEEKINLIGQKILILSNNLEKYSAELQLLKQQLELLQKDPPQVRTIQPPPVVPPIKEESNEIPVVRVEEPIKLQEQQFIPPVQKVKTASDFNFEAFIGGKLITIIGIVILVIGLGIGVKYAIDNDMLGPLARIVLAYVAGAILLVIAFRLKQKYHAFSAVLLSGGMASLYFTTFAAYSMYDLIPQMAAFGIMVIFTAFTVYAATVYNLQVIGIIGLVGAYAVPMLLSDGSGKIEIMFAYMLIVNSGILFLSFRKNWRVLNYIAFGLTWLIVLTWFLDSYEATLKTGMFMCFTFLFFLVFYISTMAYKIMKQEKFNVMDVISIVTNSFIFFGLGYAALDLNPSCQDYLGIFTVLNALVHFVFSYIVFKNKLLDRKLFYLLIALVLSFITIAVPVQLEGNWVTLFWASEAVLLFSIGRFKSIRFYEWLGLTMILLALFSLLEDWESVYHPGFYGADIYSFLTPFLNIYLFTSIFVMAAIGGVIYVHHKKALTEEEHKRYFIYRIADYALPVLFFVLCYTAFRNEISAFYDLKFKQSFMQVPSVETWAEPGALVEIYDHSLTQVKQVVLMIYSLAFFCIFTILSIRFWKNPLVQWTSFGMNMLVALIFILSGLSALGSLRDNYLFASEGQYFTTGQSHLYLRYISIFLFGLLLLLTRNLLRSETFMRFKIAKIYSGCIVHFFILIIASNELLNLNVLNNYGSEYYSLSAVYK